MWTHKIANPAAPPRLPPWEPSTTGGPHLPAQISFPGVKQSDVKGDY